MHEQMIQRRLIAWLIDALMVMGLGIWFGGLGWLASGGYWLCRDGCFDGQSVGKRLMELKVIVQPTPVRCRLRESAIRNILWVVPVVNVVMVVNAASVIIKDPRGRHWGDRLANTQVVPVT